MTPSPSPSVWEPNTPPFPSGGGRAAHRLYAHVAWATVGGVSIPAGPTFRAWLESRLIALCRSVDAEPVEACVLDERVHVVIRLKPVHSLDEVARRVRRGSEEAILGRGDRVRWSAAYAAVTVSPGEVRRLRRRLVRRAEGRPEGRRRPPAWTEWL